MLGHPLRGEFLDIRYPLGELTRDKTLDRATNQRDFEFHRPGECPIRPGLTGRDQCGTGTRSRRTGHRHGDLAAESTIAQRCPRLGVPDFEITSIELGDDPGQQVTAQVLGGGHPHGLVLLDDQGFQRGAAIEGRKPGQPVVLAAQRRMNLLDTGSRLGRHIEGTRHIQPIPRATTFITAAPSPRPVPPSPWRAIDPPAGPRNSASAPAARVARSSAGYADPGTSRGTGPNPDSWSARAWSVGCRRDR